MLREHQRYARLLIIVFVSGCVGLIYEVLWLKELTLLLGNSSYALAVTLSVFFAGIGIGSYFSANLIRRTSNTFRLYALMEIGIALGGILYLLLLNPFLERYSLIVSYFHQMTVPVFLSFVLIFPAAWFMGCTVPIALEIGERISGKRQFGVIYALNTAGGIIGALLAGFYLPLHIGFRNSYYLAICINIVLGLFTLFISRSTLKGSVSKRKSNEKQSSFNTIPMRIIFISGFLVLVLEVLWTRIFAQVFLNDTYSFTVLLIVVLAAIAVSGVVSNTLAKYKYNSFNVVALLFTISSLFLSIAPFVLDVFTNEKSLVLSQSWIGYIIQILSVSFIILFFPILCLSTILPYCIDQFRSYSVGSFIAVNTLGAILGSLIAGFVIIPFVGVWSGVSFVACTLVVCSFFVAQEYFAKNFYRKIPLLLVVIVIFSTFGKSATLVYPGETLKKVWEGSSGTVAVLSSKPVGLQAQQTVKDDLYIRMNGLYNLGGVYGLPDERRMAHIPFILHPDPKSVFVLGMGTGITAGATLFYDVEKVDVAELVPEVIDASKEYFTPYVNGLYSDPRVDLFPQDGRNYLLSTQKDYDLIIGDLFYPWNTGSGSLYSKEQFELVKNRLQDDGIFVQWLPSHQLSEFEFGVITKTMLEVFPQVTIWRANFYPEQPIIGLVAYKSETSLDPTMIRKNIEKIKNNKNELTDILLSLRGNSVFIANEEVPDNQEDLDLLSEVIPLTFYMGNATQMKDYFQKFPENTDDLPIIEFTAPQNAAKARNGQLSWMKNDKYVTFSETLMNESPVEIDPYLGKLSTLQREYVKSGLTFLQFSTILAKAQKDENSSDFENADKFFQEFVTKTKLEKVFN